MPREEREPLKVCPHCGWYDGWNHKEHCDPAAGKVAAALLTAVAPYTGTQLGYGDSKVVVYAYVHLDKHGFNDSPNLEFTVRSRSKRPLQIDTGGAWSLNRYTVEEAAEIVRALFGTAFARRY